jgi:hypothetical protein
VAKSLSLKNQLRNFMDIQAEKLYLIEELTRIQDIQIIEQIKQLLKQRNNPVAGYEINGDPITRKQLIKRIEEAEKRIDSGNYTTQEDLEKESIPSSLSLPAITHT